MQNHPSKLFVCLLKVCQLSQERANMCIYTLTNHVGLFHVHGSNINAPVSLPFFPMFPFACAVLSGSSSTTPTPVGCEDAASAPTTAEETVKLLQSVSAAASGKKTGSGGDGATTGETTSVAEEDDDNVVTTIDEVGM